MDSRSPRTKTHDISFEHRQLQYRWHPWYGYNVLVRKAGGENAATAYFCKLPEMGDEATLVELPKWMFDAAQCATMRLEEFSHVDCEALLLLMSTIIDLSPKIREVGVKTVPIPLSESRRHE